MGENKKIKILFLHSSADLYGSDKSLLRIVIALDKKRFDPAVILPCDEPLVEKLKQAGVPVDVMALGVLRRRHAHLLGAICQGVLAMIAALRIAWRVRQERIELIASNTLAVATGGLAARIAGVPHAWYVREMIQSPRYVSKFLAALLAYFADQVPVVSQAAFDHWARIRPSLTGKMTVVRNGLAEIPHATSQDAARRELGFASKDLLVGLVGRINRIKGQEVLLEAARGLHSRFPQARFICLGDPISSELWRKEDLLRKINEAGLDGCFQVREYRQDVQTFYAALDILAVPSVHPDAFPTVCIEAGLLAKPVVAFDNGGIREIVQDGITGFCVPAGDGEAFTRRLSELLQDPSLREAMGNRAQKICRENFSLQDQIIHLQTMFKTMTTAKR